MAERKTIESVKILKSQVHVGKDIKPCLAMVIDPMPTDETDIIQIGDDIKAAVMAFNQNTNSLTLNVNLEHLIELHEILCEIPFEAATLHDSEPPTERHPAIESMISELEERMEFFERRE